MKKLLLIAIAALTLAACSSDPIEQKLASYVPAEAGYKFKSYNVIDTLTNAEVADSLRNLYAVGEKVSLDEFKKQRDREFKDFRYNMPTYEEDVMRGELKDASPWCTEIREVTELADSLISVWDNVKAEDYEYNCFEAWYLARGAHYFGWADAAKWDAFSDMVKAGRNDFALLRRLSEAVPSGVHGYRVKHEYSVANPIVENGDRLIMRDVVTMDKDYNIVDARHIGK